jgi:DNA topoisomerase-1
LRPLASPAAAPPPFLSAAAAGLRYVTDALPGIRRQRRGKRFAYVDADGAPLRDPQALARIGSLVIPPAWADVWICPIGHGHLQVTARDARGRKQYRYHERWREVRDGTKFDRLAGFGRALPALRARVAADLALPGLPRAKVLATVVRLMDATSIRVGNGRYARDNGSFGATTLRNEHVRVDGAEVRLCFRGKSGKVQRVALADARLARIVRRCRELPGYELFQYVDDDGAVRAIDAADVNDYLRAAAGDGFTAKDLRTWAGTVLAAAVLRECAPPASAAEARRSVARAVEAVAAQLGNTPAICRKCYVHPAVVQAYVEQRLARRGLRGRGGKGLTLIEALVLRLLEVLDSAPPGKAPLGRAGARCAR